MKPTVRRIVRVMILTVVVGSIRGVQAGDLNPPPGSINPTMKDLNTVEPRIPVNAATTPGDAGATFKIIASGSYYLTGNLLGEVGKVGIEITASSVTLDLMGFELKGVAGATDGIRGNPVDQHTLDIRNGTFREWPGAGVDVGIARTSIVRDIRAIACGGSGIKIAGASIVERCVSAGTVATGIEAGQHCRVLDCVANNNARGFGVGGRSVVQGCVAQSNTGNGIETGGNATVMNCTAITNGAGIVVLGQSSVLDSVANSSTIGDGISVGYAAIVRGCVSTLNADDGIAATNNGVRISDCSVSINTGDGIEVLADSFIVDNKVDGNATGILVTGIDNRIDGNAVTDSLGSGVRVTGTENLIVHNTASGNAPNYDIAADNFGVYLSATIAGAAVFGASGGATVEPTNSNWANLSY
ncbi:MAG: right-handed parallel beta-helix repeat-containing protein [Phycisphaerales bacterium]|nr:right-handed parallel beta-helix repeat-containing protein [Phycisphaerales bacterium]